MKALILAGGKGTRLRPFTTIIPKPLMPVGEMPVLELLIRQLQQAGVDHVVLAVSHLKHLIESFFGNGERFGMQIEYAYEDTPLGTAGPIAGAISKLGDDFLVLNGDLLTTLSFKRLVEFHRERHAAATISVFEREIRSDFGIIEVDADSRMVGYREKPVYRHDVSMGCYALNAKSVLPFLTPGRHLDMPELMQQLAGGGSSVFCFKEPCFWLDIGRPEDYQLANELFEKDASRFLGPAAK